MTDLKKGQVPANPHLGCFGEYDAGDMICKKFCVLRLRCTIENDQNARMELIEDLISYEEMNFRLQ